MEKSTELDTRVKRKEMVSREERMAGLLVSEGDDWRSADVHRRHPARICDMSRMPLEGVGMCPDRGWIHFDTDAAGWPKSERSDHRAAYHRLMWRPSCGFDGGSPDPRHLQNRI